MGRFFKEDRLAKSISLQLEEFVEKCKNKLRKEEEQQKEQEKENKRRKEAEFLRRQEQEKAETLARWDRELAEFRQNDAS